MIQLVAINGWLHYPPNPERHDRPDENIILIHIYQEGDSLIRWPNPDMEALKFCLFDDWECGTISNDKVLLPDGTEVKF
jgi:hypothetical protein